jgi:protein KTI12
MPASGKTRRAEEVAAYFAIHHPNIPVVLLNEERFEIDKEAAHADPKKEKELRGFFRSNVDKHLNASTLVILDYMSYIKGFRYELFCLSRTAKTTHCLLLCEATLKEAKENNHGRPQGYSDEMVADLYGRMERPVECNRWDCPLLSVYREDPTPNAELHRILFLEEKKSKNPISTKSEIKIGQTYVFDLENTLLEMSVDILAKVHEAKMTGIAKFVRYTAGTVNADVRTSLTMGDIKKMKTEFLAMNKLNPFKNPEIAKEGFLYYVKGKQQ